MFEPYRWPDLRMAAPPGDWAEEMLRDVVLPAIAKLDPDSVFGYGPGVADEWPLIAGASDGVEIPIDGGTGLDTADAGGGPGAPPGPKPVDGPGVWKVIDARVSGDVDIQALYSANTLVAGAKLHAVTVADGCGTPLPGDCGLARRLPDGTVMFLPVCRRPRLSGSQYPIGDMGEDEAASTTEWDARAQPAGYLGVQKAHQGRTVYVEGGDEKLYAMYRVTWFDEFGQMALQSQETRVTVDTPGPC